MTAKLLQFPDFPREPTDTLHYYSNNVLYFTSPARTGSQCWVGLCCAWVAFASASWVPYLPEAGE